MNRGPANPLALGLVFVGAAVMAIAAFLPLLEPVGIFRVVRDNTLIQHGGWPLLVLAVGIAASGFRASQQRGGASWGLAVVLSLVAAAQIAAWFMDKDLRTLYLIGPNGNPIPDQPGIEASLGIALYVAGAGAGLALIGTLMLKKSPGEDDSLIAAWEAEETTKKCPDCAETILADAHVCRFCGYRFAADPATLPPMPASAEPTINTSKVRCHRCQHVQAVPLDAETFECEECYTKLHRKRVEDS